MSAFHNCKIHKKTHKLRMGQDRSGRVRKGQDRPGQDRTGQPGSGRYGRVRCGQVLTDRFSDPSVFRADEYDT